MYVKQSNEPGPITDQAFTVDCPHCGFPSSISAISIPRFELLERYRPPQVIIGYRCDNCNGPIAARLQTDYGEIGKSTVQFNPNSFEQLEYPQQKYEFNYLPNQVADDFREALTCYSYACYNAFAAMCRRTIQSSLTELGADGRSKIMQQLNDARSVTNLDDETYDILKQIIIAGHDGTHPNLPQLKQDRAAVLLELMKDVLYQLFVRKLKLAEAVNLRRSTIQEDKQTSP
jgi:hypothetical protein